MKILTLFLTFANILSALFVVWMIVMEIVFRADVRSCIDTIEEIIP